MTFKKHIDPTPRLNPYELGAREYSRHDVSQDDFDHNDASMDTLQEALDAHTANHRRHDDFNHHPSNQYAKLECPKLALPEGVDPHGPVLQLARAGIRGFGFASVLSIDSARMMPTSETAEQMAGWITGIGTRHNPDTGMLLFVERVEDDGLPRLQQLQEAVGELAIPRLTVITTAAPQGESPFDTNPDDPDAGPGVGLL